MQMTRQNKLPWLMKTDQLAEGVSMMDGTEFVQQVAER